MVVGMPACVNPMTGANSESPSTGTAPAPARRRLWVDNANFALESGSQTNQFISTLQLSDRDRRDLVVFCVPGQDDIQSHHAFGLRFHRTSQVKRITGT